MQFTDIFWIFLVAASVLPPIRQKLLDMARLRKLRELEKKRNSRVTALIHRQETMAFLGIPLSQYVDIDDSEQILRAIRMTDPADGSLSTDIPATPLCAVCPDAVPGR